MNDLKGRAKNRLGVSTRRRLASKFKVSNATISLNLNKLSLKYRKRQKAPKYTEEKAKKVQKKSRKLVNKSINFMDKKLQ